MANIIVTGGKGQLGQELNEHCHLSNDNFYFYSKEELDILNTDSLKKVFAKIRPRYIINCAAYTNVDRAENNEINAFRINHDGVKNLVKVSKDFDTTIIHLSSDYVYHNGSDKPMPESSLLSPKGAYARSKKAGEDVLKNEHNKHVIIRSSWIYSCFGHNFLKTMLRFSQTKDQLTIVNDQIGTPTYARDLAVSIIKIIQKINNANCSDLYGTYNYANSGSTNWADFARFIFKCSGATTQVNGCSTENYGAPAPRPKWSVLDCSKIKEAFCLEIPDWKSSAKQCIEAFQKTK